MSEPQPPHILLVSFPAQGHINPTLQLAERLIRIGFQITFATSFSAHKHMLKTQNIPAGMSTLGFSDGHDQGFTLGDGSGNFMSQFKLHGMKNLKNLILDINSQGRRPVTHIIYCHLVYWASAVARELHIPSTMLWNQAAAVLAIYYYNFHGYEDFIRENVNKTSFSVTFPGLPLLRMLDLPSFFHPSNVHGFVLPLLKQLFEILDDKETSTRVLVNTFDALEPEILKVLNKYPAIGVGPLIPSAFLDERDMSKENLKEYTKWLSSKASNSVIYVSFGSLSVLAMPQMEEIARALVDTGHSFLWVIRETKKGEELSCRGELEKQGMIVPWCTQLEVLSHPSIGCFISHCGWNSTFESLSCGVPMVGFPQWTDQATNVKLVQDVWKTGVRVAERNDGLVEADEIKRCLDLVMMSNERGEEMRLNAKKWKELAREAAMESGSSDKNLKTFVDEVSRGYIGL